MKIFRLLASVVLLALCVAPVHAATTDYNWKVVDGDGGFPTGYDTGHGETVGGISGGGFHASAECGTILAGESIWVIVAINGASGDPGAITQTSGTTLTQVYNHDNSNRGSFRTAVFYRKVTTNGEACAWAFTWTGDLDMLDWAVVDFKPSTGSGAATVIDVAATDMDSYLDGDGSTTATGISPANAGDTLLYINTFFAGPYTHTAPATTTGIVDTGVDGGAWSVSAIFMATKTLSSSGATGNYSGTYSTSFKDQNNALITLNAPAGGGGGGGGGTRGEMGLLGTGRH